MVLSAFGVLGLGLTLWFNFRALDLAEREANETKGALATAERNADAARDQVALAERTAKHQLRAYVGVETAWLGMEDQLDHIAIRMKNFGATPAIGLEMTAIVSIDRPPPHRIQPVIGEPETRPKIDVPPGQVITNSFTIPHAASVQSEADKGGKISIVARVRYSYTDAFGRTFDAEVSISSVNEQIKARGAGICAQTQERERPSN